MKELARIGSTDLVVSRVGFGGCPMGGHGWGHVDDRQTISAIHKALDLGINFFDTADVYGFGHSEEILSRGLGVHRREVVISTKFGVRWDSRGRIRYDTSRTYLEEAITRSLKRLRIDTIPLYQIHWPGDPSTPIEDTLEGLVRLREQGKIRVIGVSNFSPQLLDEVQQICRIDSLQIQYSLAFREAEKGALGKARELGMAVLTWGSLAQGLFSGKYGPEIRFGSDDRRHRYDNFMGKKFRDNLKILGRLRVVAGHYGKTPAQVAIRWLLDTPGVSLALTGIKNSEQIIENHGSMGWRLAPEHRAWIGDGSARIPAPEPSSFTNN